MYFIFGGWSNFFHFSVLVFNVSFTVKSFLFLPSFIDKIKTKMNVSFMFLRLLSIATLNTINKIEKNPIAISWHWMVDGGWFTT